MRIKESKLKSVIKKAIRESFWEDTDKGHKKAALMSVLEVIIEYKKFFEASKITTVHEMLPMLTKLYYRTKLLLSDAGLDTEEKFVKYAIQEILPKAGKLSQNGNFRANSNAAETIVFSIFSKALNKPVSMSDIKTLLDKYGPHS